MSELPVDVVGDLLRFVQTARNVLGVIAQAEAVGSGAHQTQSVSENEETFSSYTLDQDADLDVNIGAPLNGIFPITV